MKITTTKTYSQKLNVGRINDCCFVLVLTTGESFIYASYYMSCENEYNWGITVTHCFIVCYFSSYVFFRLVEKKFTYPLL